MSITCGRRASPPSCAPEVGGAGPRSCCACVVGVLGEQLPPPPPLPLPPRRAAAAAAAFPCGIWNPCASLTMKQSSNVPAFLSKLWTLVEETHTNEFITWSQVRVSVRRPPNPLTNRLLSHSLPRGCLSRPVAGCPVRGPWVGGAGWASAFGLAGDLLYCSRGEPRGSQPATLVQAAVGEGRPAQGPAAWQAP